MAITVFEFADFKLDCDRFELCRAGRSLKLERKPMELLILLAVSNGRLVTRAEIAERLWDSEVFVDTEHGITRRSAAHQNEILNSVPSTGQQFQSHLQATQHSLTNFFGPATTLTPAESTLYQQLQRQASEWAFVDVFRWLSLLCFVSVAIVWLLKRVKPAKPPPPPTRACIQSRIVPYVILRMPSADRLETRRSHRVPGHRRPAFQCRSGTHAPCLPTRPHVHPHRP
jgi:hypothetical protein